ncbi:YgiQ family radical SAM protein [Treponema sp.]|uniref:YgiQ family radical SAM protein n=1 Tax=Treponema sp. TaxID=166 RepID=UPI002600414D|nr:YgiQ family radical SAM protein [Treponema sp.]MCR5217402.1 YgiQ family radical SAM protein [Treponema sp.]
MNNERLKFLPVSPEDLAERGISEPDFVFVSGDAYVDHASFAAAILGRLLEAHGYTVAILAQPDWHTTDDFKKFGRPKLGFLVSAGAMDSMVSNYTANNKPRSEDDYAHGGEKGHRPDHALLVYVQKIRESFKGVNVVIGGIEASLRRTSHYDYWSNTVKKSVLLDSKADLLIYGMGEHAILEIAAQLKAGKTAREIRDVRGTCWYTGKESDLPEKDFIMLPSYEEVSKNTPECKENFARSYLVQEENTDAINGKALIEKADSRFVVQNPASLPLTQEEMDSLYKLPFMRKWHPDYDGPAANGKSGVPALSEVKFSLTSCRGCYGACSFCAITFHQGRRIQSRSHESLIEEAKLMTEDADFKGYIHDVGGPTANFRKDACKFQKERGACQNKDCLGVNPCKNVEVSHKDYVDLLQKLRALPKVKKVFIRSGIRFDYLMMDKDRTFFYELCKHHISGQLKVAPEHVSDSVLKLMRKSTHKVYEEFSAEYARINKELGLKQYLVPYYIAGHPGAGLKEALETALYLKKTGFVPDQVQDFYPTPGSLATCMYYTGFNPHEKKADGHLAEVYVARGGRERRLQRALLQFNRRENKPLVIEALKSIGRMDALKILY